MATFITPFSGTAELTASNGLQVISQGSWRFSQSGFNDGATFGVSLGGPLRLGASDFYYGPNPNQPPAPIDAGVLELRAEDWTIAGVGNALTAYTDPATGITYSAAQCRIEVVGQWQVTRQPNSNSFNGQGVIYTGLTATDEGDRAMNPYLLSFTATPRVTYRIQGAEVEGGAEDTFSSHVFFCRITQSATTDNSNQEFQSNSIARPVWAYAYSKSWQISA